MSLTPQALRVLSRELVALQSEPLEGVRVVLDEEDLTSVEGWVQGPAGTPYDGGYWKVRFEFGLDYPNMPPKCTMQTKIFHPNVSKSGEICVDTLKKGWKKEYGVGHVLVTIKCLLIYPNPESALDEEAGKQLLADYEGYCKYAKLMTSIHATPRSPPVEFRDASATTSTSSASSSSKLPSSDVAPGKIPSPACQSPNPPLTLTGSSSRPAPLGQTIQQEQSPSIQSSATMGDEEGVKKVVVVGGAGVGSGAGAAGGAAGGPKVAGGAKVVKKAPAGGAKRGLKRL